MRNVIVIFTAAILVAGAFVHSVEAAAKLKPITKADFKETTWTSYEGSGVYMTFSVDAEFNYVFHIRTTWTGAKVEHEGKVLKVSNGALYLETDGKDFDPIVSVKFNSDEKLELDFPSAGIFTKSEASSLAEADLSASIKDSVWEGILSVPPLKQRLTLKSDGTYSLLRLPMGPYPYQRLIDPNEEEIGNYKLVNEFGQWLITFENPEGRELLRALYVQEQQDGSFTLELYKGQVVFNKAGAIATKRSIAACNTLVSAL